MTHPGRKRYKKTYSERSGYSRNVKYGNSELEQLLRYRGTSRNTQKKEKLAGPIKKRDSEANNSTEIV